MSSSLSSLESLVLSCVPQSRQNDSLKNELITHCTDILNSHIGQSSETDIGHLSELVKRHLVQTRPDGVASLQFTNLLSRLLEQPILSRKHDALLFLHTLASSPRPSTAKSTFLPSLAPPPPIRSNHAPQTSISTPTNKLPPRGKSKAELLREYRLRSGKSHIPEDLLLRDTLYLLQGISGKYIRFSPPDNDDTGMKLVFVEESGYSISQPVKALIHRLSEVGHLYTLVDRFIQEQEQKSGIGMIEQSLCHHLQSQLTEYYRLIAVLESQMATLLKSPTTDDDQPNGFGDDIRLAETGLTLKRLDVWVDEWRLRMRMMSVCVEAARDTQGGALVNLIHSYAENGDPFVRRFTDQLLEEVSKPFFEILHKWLLSGELSDPYAEFFVAVDPELAHLQYVNHPGAFGQPSGDGGFGGLAGDQDDLSDERESGLRLWETKYRFQKEMLPTFVGEGFGRKIFSTGKSLNFIRYSCHDTDWIATREKLNSTGSTLQYSDISGLERSIDAAYRIASQRLFDVFFEKFRLLDHLKALKNYLFLGHGDFADQLMETLGPNLSRPANTLYRHNLTATLETAIRSSNAQSDPPDVLRRLDARMLEYTHGEIGWDVFTLEYKVDAPIDTVLDPESMVKYLKLFNHLWKLKRIESTLTKAWMRVVNGTRMFIHLPELEQEWHKIRVVVSEMIHFIRQMEAYCQLDVIECSWKSLLDYIQDKEGDLDGLIDAHRSYLDRMVKKILLLSPKAGKEENLLNQVRDTLTTVLQFRDATDNFYNYCLTESARRDSQRDQERGVYTTDQKLDSPHSSEQLDRILGQVQEYHGAFSDKVHTIIHNLQSHPDLDCRFLAIRLSFSDFYRSKK
ncbi:gamma-tubulin complex DGRIP91/SPC98 component [Dentipellis sp. KUC8613]|nr:gamma-tubulin complex DGRIP91/SPC98 component [Dentipellis sp. KUC8613]